MMDPLQITFGILASTGNGHAVEVLASALDVSDPDIQQRAVSALVKRGQVRGLIEVIRRLPQLPPATRGELVAQGTRLSPGIRQSLVHGDRALRSTALELTLECNDFEQLGALLSLLQDRDCVTQDEVAQTIRALVDRIYDYCHDDSRRHSAVASQARLRALIQLDHAIEGFAKLSMPDVVVHAVLVLGDPDHYAVKRLVAHHHADCRNLAMKILTTDSHPGVMQLMLDSMARNYPLAKTFETVSRRSDIEFVCHLLRWAPERPTLFQQKNLKQLESIAWIDSELSLLEQIPPGLQPALVRFVAATGLPADRKLAVQEWLLRHGASEGREAAASAMSRLETSAVQDILFDGLESQSEDVQAWATSQLRQQNIPHAVAMLVDRLDSPMPAVRLAAQGELQDFNIRRMLEMFDQLDPDLCRRTGELIRKTDPQCVEQLDYELSHPVRRRRIRAARAALALGLHREVGPALLLMLEDIDPLVRRSAIEALADVPDPQILEVLLERQKDDSPRVRDTARRAVEHWRKSFRELQPS